MPQLEITTFSSQIFWLLVGLLILYVTLSTYILPQISQTLKVREKYLKKSEGQVSGLKDEETEVLESYDNFIKESAQEVYTLFNEISIYSDKWANDTKNILNSTQLEKANKSFIKAMLNLTISRKLIKQHI